MPRAFSPLVILILMLSSRAMAIGAPRGCQVRSAELKLARECYTGDMRSTDDGPMFVGVDETSPVDLNYCFNAFVAPYPTKGTTLSVLVLKDDPKGAAVARTYTVGVAQLAGSLGRIPTNHKAQVMRLNGMTAQCYAKSPMTNKCSKGFFGWGGTDLPFAITLENGLHGYQVRGGVRDRGLIEMPGVPTVAAGGITPAAQTLDWLSGQVKQRLLSRSRRDLATITASPDEVTRSRLNAGAGQYQFCRLAYDVLNQRLRRPDPFTPDESKMLEDLDQRLRDPGSLPASSTPAMVSVPASAPRVPAANVR